MLSSLVPPEPPGRLDDRRPFSMGGRSSKGQLCARSRANHSDGRTNDAYSLSQVTAERVVYCCIHGRHGAEATYEVDDHDHNP